MTRIVDLEQRDVSNPEEQDREISQQRSVASPGLTAGEGRVLERFESSLDGVVIHVSVCDTTYNLVPISRKVGVSLTAHNQAMGDLR